MATKTRSIEAVKADEELLIAYIEFIIRHNRESGLYREIKKDYDRYRVEKNDRDLRLLAKEVRVIVNDTFTEGERKELDLKLKEAVDPENLITATLDRGAIDSEAEYAILESYVDKLVKRGEMAKVDVINAMLATFCRKRLGK